MVREATDPIDGVAGDYEVTFRFENAEETLSFSVAESDLLGRVSLDT